MKSLRHCVFLLAAAFAGAGAAAPVKTPNVEAELVAERTALVPGQPTSVALRLKLAPGWHTYWRNPGDSGLPTTLDWKLPGGVYAGPLQWPVPKQLPVGPLVNYGYEGEVLHPVTLTTVPDFLSGRDVELAARADWLVCKEICIPEGADLTLTLPVANRADPDPRWGSAIAAVKAALPQPLAGWTANANAEGQRVKLVLTPPAGAADPGTLQFFAHDEGRIEASGRQVLTRDGDRYVLVLPVAYQLQPGFTRVAGVLDASRGLGGVRAATLDIPLTGTVVAGPKPASESPPVVSLAAGAAAGEAPLAFALAALFAFLGGIILNLMPCVFPVLSIKVLGFAQHDDSRATMRVEAVAFASGVVLTFVALAVVLLALRAAGEQLGWGFQLQSPVVVTGLALLFFVLALNLSGLFEFGQFAPASIRGWTSTNRSLDAFGSGVLAVVVASPCTAPFMGAAMGYALAQPPAATLAVFVALGLGMALPYVLLAVLPGWRSVLPKPGEWMVRFKQLLAFPLFATVAWLAWVLGAQLDNDAVLRLTVTLVGVALALWSWQAARTGGARGWTAVALVALAGAVIVALPLLTVDAKARESASARPDGEWSAYVPARVAELAAAGRPVFVDFTAAWCVTCQVNKRTTLDRAEVRAAFTRNKVALVRADWTRRDPQITQALAALGRNGVPVYVLYRPGREPLLLPEVLTQQIMLDALAAL